MKLEEFEPGEVRRIFFDKYEIRYDIQELTIYLLRLWHTPAKLGSNAIVWTHVGKGSRGKLSLAALPSLAAGIVTSKLGEFHRSHPGVRISLSERKNDQILEAVRRGEVELGVGSMWQSEPELSFQPLFTDHLMFVAPQGHPLVDMRPVWKCADKFDLILINAGPTEHALKLSDVKRPPAYEVEHLATALAMVRHGMGISILPSSVVPTLNMDGLVCLPILGNMATRQIGMIFRNGNRPSTPVSAFAELLKSSHKIAA